MSPPRPTMREMDARIRAEKLVRDFDRNPISATKRAREDAIVKALLGFADDCIEALDIEMGRG